MDGFDFDFGGAGRAELLSDARDAEDRRHKDLGGGSDPRGGVDSSAALDLLVQLAGEVAEFSKAPEFVRLEEAHFAEQHLALPKLYHQLAAENQFYWLRVPLVLKPLDGMPFARLKCGIELETDGAPAVTQIVLPDKKFRVLFEARDEMSLAIDEEFQLKVMPDAKAGVPIFGKAEAGASANLSLRIGPFNYRLSRAELDHSGTGSHKVFWSMEGTEHIHEQEPTLLVVVRVPKGTKVLRVSAALQAYHSFRFLAGTFGELIRYVHSKLKNFFKTGAPAADTQVWDLSSRL